MSKNNSDIPNNPHTIDDLNIFDKFSRRAKRAIIASYDLARRDKSNTENKIEPKHLFVAILKDKKNLATRLLETLNVDTDQTANTIIGELSNSFKSQSLVPSDLYQKIVAESFLEAANLGHVYVGCEHLILTMLRFEDISFIRDLSKSGLNYKKIRNEIKKFGTYQPGVFSKKTDKKTNEGNPSRLDNNQQNSALEFFGKNMVDAARDGEYLPIYGREEEIDRVIHILARQTKNNPILVGEPGVGKTAIIEGLAQRIMNGNVPSIIKDLEILKIDIASIIAGAKVRGDIEERILTIMEEVKESDNKVIFIDEVHTIIGAGNMGGSSDIANILKPYLTDGDMRVIGATTSAEYTKYFEEDGALSRRFQPVDVKELDEESTLSVLSHLRNTFEEYHRVKISDEALDSAVKLSKRYITDRFLPDKAIDLIDEAAAKEKIKKVEDISTEDALDKDMGNLKKEKKRAIKLGHLDLASEIRKKEIVLQSKITQRDKDRAKVDGKYLVEPEDIRQVISSWTKIPVSSLTLLEIESIGEIQQKLESKIIGQVDAINKVSGALKRAKLGFTDNNRPLASLLLLGPTGVGKTETAKVIAKELFGKDESLIQINMSEFMESHSVSKLIGAPPGYVGYSDGNHITEQVRKQPYSVVLFDEVEKAHVDTLNILLQILDEGYVQDSKGRKVNFRNTIVILTSNIGADEIASDNTLGFDVIFSDKDDNQIEKAYDEMRSEVMSQLKDYLRPEFINRLDEIIVFRGLGEEDMKEITSLQIENLNSRLKERFVQIDPTYQVVNMIAEEGFSKEYGARNIRRKVQELLENNLADFLLNNNLIDKLQKLSNSNDVSDLLLNIDARVKDGEIIFEYKQD